MNKADDDDASDASGEDGDVGFWQEEGRPLAQVIHHHVSQREELRRQLDRVLHDTRRTLADVRRRLRWIESLPDLEREHLVSATKRRRRR
jgi:hypothetical protein